MIVVDIDNEQASTQPIIPINTNNDISNNIANDILNSTERVDAARLSALDSKFKSIESNIKNLQDRIEKLSQWILRNDKVNRY